MDRAAEDGDGDQQLSSDEFVQGILKDTEGMSEEDFNTNWLLRMTKCIEDRAPACKRSRTLAEVGNPRFSEDLNNASWLGGVVGNFPHVPMLDAPCEPAVQGDMSDFELPDMNQLRNKVLVCPNCSKPNAYTLKVCNSCGTSLEEVEISKTNNIFTGFIYGIQKGPFPYTISLRSQNENFIVFDDLLVMCSCHINIVPTSIYIADLRSLLKKPAEALQLITAMKDEAWKVVREQFIQNPEWKSKLVNDSENLSEDDLKSALLMGFNFPPSQFQLHMQCMLLPFTPFHYSLFHRGTHFTYGRFFPCEYMEAVLATNVALTQDEPSADDLIAFYDQQGVCYEDHHKALTERADRMHKKLANWSEDDFKYRYTEDGTATPLREGLEPAPDADEVSKNDKLLLQNYGRPYNDQGKPAGTYYSFAKREQIPNW